MTTVPHLLISIQNAGLTLVNPFIQVLFKRLEYLTDETAFKDVEHAERAALLLQYLCSGNEKFASVDLTLNRLICGLDPDHVLVAQISPTDAEKELCRSLLKSIITRWDKLNNTSVERLRETFLMREGSLNTSPGSNSLVVSRKPFDILISTLPWNINIITHPWMKEKILVKWER
jgi:hypothetical protein